MFYRFLRRLRSFRKFLSVIRVWCVCRVSPPSVTDDAPAVSSIRRTTRDGEFRGGRREVSAPAPIVLLSTEPSYNMATNYSRPIQRLRSGTISDFKSVFLICLPFRGSLLFLVRPRYSCPI